MEIVLRITSGKLKGTRLFFPPGQYLFGRAPGCHVLFSPTSIASRKHCLLLVGSGAVSVRDLQSRNGTFVNKQPVAGEQQLAANDLLSVGETTFRVEIDTAAQLEPASAVEVSGKPLGETIDMPLDRTAHETKLVT